MDTTGFSQVGRYGTLSLLRRHNTPGAVAGSNTQPKEATGSPGQTRVITSFGIDSANLTFGRALTCDIRLYYQEVDPVHCRLVNEDGKAFLAVQGKTGALIDGCWVYPHPSSPSSNTSEELQQTITPLTNNSEFEIHSKRFRFTYPPKEVRKVLLATPVAQRNRTLRLSMIQSAQVFTPRPSKDPRENLRILQSPLKTSIFGVGSNTDAGARDRSTSPSKPRAVSPLKFGVGPDDDDDSDEDLDEEQDENLDASESNGEEHIILAHTNHPRVVEEDRDLVILEDVPLHLVLPSPSVYSAGTPVRSVRQPGNMGPPATPTPVQAQPQLQQIQPQPQPPRTPRRKSLGGTALHRAVLIRSAQRAVWRAEREKEEEEEEMEVLGAVVAPGDADEREEEGMEEDDEGEYEQEDVEMRSVSDSDEERSIDGDEEVQEGENEEGGKEEPKPLWKKSLERIIPWTFGAKRDGKEEEKTEEHLGYDNDDEHDDEERNEKLASLPVLPQQQTPIRRALGSFMTPQAGQPTQARNSIFPSTTSITTSREAPAVTGTNAGPGRYSLGGGEARRVVVHQPWRVKDLVVPPIAGTPSSVPAPAPVLRPMDPPSTPGSSGAPRPSISEEERKAIQERRRSAVREVREDSFWKDGAPGMSPAKARPSPAKPPPGLSVGLGRPSVMTTPSMGGGMTTPRRPLASPTKGRSLGYSIAEVEGEEGDSVFLDNKAGSSKDQDNKFAVAVDEDDESTVGLLERMRETVEDMKRRRSVATLATPRTTLLDGDNTGMPDVAVRGSVKKLDFTHITPAQPKRVAGAGAYVTPGAKIHADTSSAFSSETTKVDEDEAETSKESDEPEPFSLLRLGARPSLSPKKRELPSDAQENQNVPVVVVDTIEDNVDQPEQSDTKTRGRTRGRPRLLRAPKELDERVDDQNVEEEEQEPAQSKSKSSSKPASKSKPPSASKPRSRTAKSPVPPTIPESSLAPEPSGSGPRRQRSRTPQPPPAIDEVGPGVEQVPTRSVPRRTRKGTAEPEEPPVASKRKGKKAEPEPEPEPELDVDAEEEVVEKVKPTPAKRGRKPRAAATPIPIEEEEEEEVAAPPAVKRSRSKKAKEPVPTVDEEEDELDSYEVAPPAAASKKPSRIPGQVPTLARGQKKAAEIATHEPPVEEEEEPAPLATTRGGRGARTNSNTTTTKTPAPAATSRTKTPTNTTTAGKATAGTGKPRGRPKTPASAPAIVATSAIADDIAEKENTPGAGSGSANGSDEEPAVTKVRVSRKAGATTGAAAGSGKAVKTTSRVKAKAAVKIEQNEDEEDGTVAAGRTRATRIMRTRTKTG